MNKVVKLKIERLIIHATFVGFMIAVFWSVDRQLGPGGKITEIATGIGPMWAMLIALYLPTLSENQRRHLEAVASRRFIQDAVSTMVIELEEVSKLGATFEKLGQQLTRQGVNPPGLANRNQAVRPYFDRAGPEVSKLGPEIIRVIARREASYVDAKSNFERSLQARPVQPGDLLQWAGQLANVCNIYIADLENCLEPKLAVTPEAVRSRLSE